MCVYRKFNIHHQMNYEYFLDYFLCTKLRLNYFKDALEISSSGIAY